MVMIRIRISAARFILRTSRWFAGFICPELREPGDRRNGR